MTLHRLLDIALGLAVGSLLGYCMVMMWFAFREGWRAAGREAKWYRDE